MEPKRKRPLCQRFVDAFESTQVELRGQYSVERLCTLQKYTERTSLCRVIAVIMLTPVPCVALTLLLEVMPLAPPSKGISHSQNAWVRAFASVFLMTWCQFDQCRRLVTNLPFTPASVVRVSCIATTGAIAIGIGLSLLIGFPLPFTLTMMLPGWFLLSGIYFYVMFRDLILQDAQIRRELWLVGGHLLLQGIMCLLYPLVGYVFATSTSRMQGVYSLMLPVLKLATKNGMYFFLRHKEDFLPEVVILNVEIFHGLFVCTCMQNANSFASIAIIMIIDTLHSILAIRDVNALVATVKTFCDSLPSRHQMRRVPIGETVVYTLSTVPPSTLLHMIRIQSDAKLRSTSQEISLKRWTCLFRWIGGQSARVVDEGFRGNCNSTLKSRASMVDVVAFVTPSQVSEVPQYRFLAESLNAVETKLTAEDKATIDALTGKRKLRFVRQALKLFHMTEFLLLVELTEVVIPVIYGAFLVVVFHLPNRVYYQQIQNWDTHQLDRKIWNLFAYASLELLSFIVLVVLLKRKMHLSTLHQLAFVLETQWAGVQSRLLVWVMFLVQGSVEHYGVDPTFKFAWLKLPSS